jgi:Tfp pilus assembly pilus retraction ATPase PilT
MQTFNQALADLTLKGTITKEQAYLRTSMIEELKGIYDSYQY